MPKALPRIERDVIVTCNAYINTAECHVKWANFALHKFNHIIGQSANITLPPFILA
jgi:hypothetical protein